MRRTVLLVGLGILLVAVAAGTALAALRVGNDNPNDLFGTSGDNQGQDTLLGLGAADQLAGGFGPDRLEGNDGNDTLDGDGRRTGSSRAKASISSMRPTATRTT